MNDNEIAREIVDAAYQVHRKLGPGLLESVYETVLVFDLEKRGLNVRVDSRRNIQGSQSSQRII
jgi:GxxExxY protein